jgi:hypothetical protein
MQARQYKAILGYFCCGIVDGMDLTVDDKPVQQSNVKKYYYGHGNADKKYLHLLRLY